MSSFNIIMIHFTDLLSTWALKGQCKCLDPRKPVQVLTIPTIRALIRWIKDFALIILESQSVTSVTTRVESWRSCCRQRTSRTRASCNGISIIFAQYPSQIVVMTRALEENLRRWTIEFGPNDANTSDLQDEWEWKKISSDESNNVKIWFREQKGYYAYTYDMIAL